jgi:hypothetical protein
MSKKRKRTIYAETEIEKRSSLAATLSGRSAASDFNPDYSYVRKDLRRIGALAGTFLAILFILALFLR